MAVFLVEVNLWSLHFSCSFIAFTMNSWGLRSFFINYWKRLQRVSCFTHEFAVFHYLFGFALFSTICTGKTHGGFFFMFYVVFSLNTSASDLLYEGNDKDQCGEYAIIYFIVNCKSFHSSLIKGKFIHQ